jgi:hypothetical protein
MSATRVREPFCCVAPQLLPFAGDVDGFELPADGRHGLAGVVPVARLPFGCASEARSDVHGHEVERVPERMARRYWRRRKT